MSIYVSEMSYPLLFKLPLVVFVAVGYRSRTVLWLS